LEESTVFIMLTSTSVVEMTCIVINFIVGNEYTVIT
jgi:hypothetical protein